MKKTAQLTTMDITVNPGKRIDLLARAQVKRREFFSVSWYSHVFPLLTPDGGAGLRELRRVRSLQLFSRLTHHVSLLSLRDNFKQLNNA